MRASAVVRDRIRGKASGLGRRGELDVRLRASEMCEEDGDRGIDGRCGYSIRRQTKDGLHVARVHAGLKRRE